MGFFDFSKSNRKPKDITEPIHQPKGDVKATCDWCGYEYSISSLNHAVDFNMQFCEKQDCNQKYLEVMQLHNGVSELLGNKDAREYMVKYLKSKDTDFKLALNYIVDKINILDFITPMGYELDDSEKAEINSHILDSFHSSLNSQIENTEDIDSKLQLNAFIDHTKDLTKDINMLVQLFGKQNIEVNAIQCTLAINELMLPELREIAEPIVGPAFKAISAKTTSDKKVIVKAFLKLNNKNTLFYIKRLFDKFQLSYTETELINLENQCKDEIELEEFESDLGVKKQKKIDSSFDKLNGYEFESYAKNLFQLLGYQAITTKLSSDQGADLILSKDNIKTVVQCKHYTDPVSNKAVQEVVAAKNHYDCDEAIVICTSSFTKSAIELAKSNKVDLWDRDKIEQTINHINKQL